MTCTPRVTSPRASRAPFVLAALLSLTLAAPAVPALAAPIYFPPDVSGWPGAILDEDDTAPYLSYHQAAAMRMSMQRAPAGPLVASPAQRRYDARTYDLDLYPNVVTHVLTGSVHMTATVVDGPLSTLDLDLVPSMNADSVRVAGTLVATTHVGDVLTVTLDRAYANGELVDLTIWYHGAPSGGTFGSAWSWDTRAGKPHLWTLSEAYGARSWWPCKDWPEDKADSVTVRMTVPTGMITASNGTLISSSDNGTVAVTQWKERHPITTYLVSIASYAYTVVNDWYKKTPTDSMLIRFHLYPEWVSSGAATHAKVKGMIAAFAARMGPYPFFDEKYGHANFQWGGGMEHQTCTSIGGTWESVTAHELGHQWWGDNVTCADFHHIWLNEGFATYTEALWKEAGGGLAAYQTRINSSRYYGAGTIYVADEYDENAVFDGNLSYNKGGVVLHMLRHVMGDTLFFDALRAYGAAWGGRSATTEDFRDVCESVGGRDLDKFFAEWIYGEYYPQYRHGWSTYPDPNGGYTLSLVIGQEQTWQKFWMPVDVRVTTASGSQTFVAWDSLAVQSFLFHVDQVPTAVSIDPDGWILRTATPYPTAVEGTAPALALSLATPWPNPTRAGAALSFALPQAGPVRVAVYDVRGARVWTHDETNAGAGAHQLTWDGRDSGGHAVAAGLYVVRLETAVGTVARRLAVVR
jgi:aminopeptidase N